MGPRFDPIPSRSSALSSARPCRACRKEVCPEAAANSALRRFSRLRGFRAPASKKSRMAPDYPDDCCGQQCDGDPPLVALDVAEQDVYRLTQGVTEDAERERPQDRADRVEDQEFQDDTPRARPRLSPSS